MLRVPSVLTQRRDFVSSGVSIAANVVVRRLRRPSPRQTTVVPDKTGGGRLASSSPKPPISSASVAPRTSRSSSVMATECSAVYVPVPDTETAKRIGRVLVTERLAACVNIVPGLTSIYTWENELQEEAELLLMIKTKSALVKELTDKIEELHPYDVSGVVSIEVSGGSEAYLDWVKNSTKPV